ncbi:tetratricopeptide repeat protein [Propionivibrio sp.]|uniref:tetratricopeptide repeat protein n=1 Tax=Propionivibrio sp. TaxID=2212460 RepID=UPI0039E369EA
MIFVANQRRSTFPLCSIVTGSALLVTLLFAVYWPGLHGDFFFDDTPSILTPDGVRMTSLSWASLRDAFYSGTSGPLLRPIAQLSFALNYLWRGFDPFLFKITNLAIHVTNTLLAFIFVYQLMQRGEHTNKRHCALEAAIITALWALHPIQLLAILHAVQRMTSLSAGFLLLGLILHLQARDAESPTRKAMLFAGAWLACWPLSILSKETGLLFPFLVLICEFFYPHTLGKRQDTFTRGLALACVISALSAIIYLLLPAGRWILAGYDFRPFSLSERLMTEARVLWNYADLLIAPRFHVFAIHHDDIPISSGLLSPPTTLIALIAWTAVLLLAWLCRKKQPAVSFGVFWFLTGHALESSFLPLEIAHEHRNYLPSLGLIFAGVVSISQLQKRVIKTKAVIAIITVIPLAYFSLITALRAHEFGDTLRLTQMEANNHPNSPRAQNTAGSALAALPQARDPISPIHALARYHYEASTRLSPSEKGSLLGLINLECNAGLKPSPPLIQELEKRLASPPFAPGDRNILFSIKETATTSPTFCLTRTDVDALFSGAFSNPSVTPWVKAIIHSWYADYLWLNQRDFLLAKRNLEDSLTLSPNNPSNQLKLAQLFFLSGEHGKATALLKQLRAARLNQGELRTLNELLAATKLAD